MNVRLVAITQQPETASIAIDMLAAYLAGQPDLAGRVEVTTRDYCAQSDEQIAQETLATAPDVVGLSCYVWNVDRCLEIARRIKEGRAECRVVLGGPELCGVEADVLAQSPQVDVVVHGEGEVTFSELVRRWLDGGSPLGDGCVSPIAGVSARDDARGVCTTAPRTTATDVATLPSPYLTGTFFQKHPRGARIRAIVEQHRGCPFRCAFCYWGRGARQTRWFDEARVVAELDALDAAEIPELFFADASFTMRRDRARRILAHLATKRFHDVVIHVEPDSLDDEMLAAIARVPALTVCVGLQAVKRETLEHVHRGSDLAGLRDGIEALVRTGRRIVLQAIFALPTDSPDDFRATLRFGIGRSPAPEMQLFHLQVLPGSELWHRREDLGIGLSARAPHYLHEAPTLTAADVQRMKLDAWLTTTLHNHDALRYTNRALAARTSPSGAVAPPHDDASLLFALADRIWREGDLHDLPDGSPRANGLPVGRLFERARECVKELCANDAPLRDAALDALAVDEVVGALRVRTRNGRSSSPRAWVLAEGADTADAIPWDRVPRLDGPHVTAAGHSRPLQDILAGRIGRTGPPRTTIAWMTPDGPRVLELPEAPAAARSLGRGSERLPTSIEELVQGPDVVLWREVAG